MENKNHTLFVGSKKCETLKNWHLLQSLDDYVLYLCEQFPYTYLDTNIPVSKRTLFLYDKGEVMIFIRVENVLSFTNAQKTMKVKTMQIKQIKDLTLLLKHKSNIYKSISIEFLLLSQSWYPWKWFLEYKDETERIKLLRSNFNWSEKKEKLRRLNAKT